MLESIYVKNFVLFDELEVSLDSKLTVFTGETGAGKSLLLDALSLLCGKKASTDCIRIGAFEAVVEGTVNCEQITIPSEFQDFIENGRLVITRRISSQKASVIRLNGQTITLKQLQHLMSYVVSIIGQHDYMHLNQEGFQLSVIDGLSSDIRACLVDYQAVFEQYQAFKKQLNDLQSKRNLNQNDLDLAAFQYNELVDANFKVDEDTDLAQQKKTLNALEKNRDRAQKMIQSLKRIEDEAENLLGVIGSDEEFEDLTGFASTLAIQAAEYYEEQQKTLQNLQGLEAIDIDDIESRLDVIFKFKQKYKATSVNELLDIQNALAKKLNKEEDVDTVLPKLEKELAKLEIELENVANLLHETRLKYAKPFEEKVCLALKQLNILHPSFDVGLSYKPGHYSELGASAVTFKISMNPGVPVQPLQEVASGGELSRILLAVHSQSPDALNVPTYLYDEIDTGVGGLTATRIGEYLNSLAHYKQIILVTHLPQIAQFATGHYRVLKETDGKETFISVKALNSEEQKQEFERLLGGDTVLKRLK